MSYQRDSVKAPVLGGTALKAFVAVLESPVGGVILDKVVMDSGLGRFREKDPGQATPLQVPLPPGSPPTEPSATGYALAERAATTPAGERMETVGAFARAYRAGTTDPTQVVRRLHEFITRIDGGDEKMNVFISRKPDQVLAAAEASAERLRTGRALSVFDGVPVVVKDEVDMAGFPTTLGTSFRGVIAEKDSTVVARLKAAGAVILGKANMNEIGISTVGLNPHYGPARNPYGRGHITGGSSSASASAVAMGLCPVSVGADGGGSIRVPAALCGVVGLKPTFGRVPETGVPPLCWHVGHLGPIGLTVADVAAAYAVLAGTDGEDPMSLHQSAVHLSGFEDGSLAGVRLGVCTPYFEDADPAVVAASREALKSLTARGATVVELPPPDLNTILWTHSVIILSEMADAMRGPLEENSSRFALDSRTNLAIGRHFRSTDYVHALRHRHALTREYLKLMQNVDAIVTPTTASTAPLIPEATLPDGESNLPVVDALMRFIRVGNLTGFPGISVPAGYDAGGLPVGVHFLARPYEEHLLLRLARVVEAASPHRVPGVHVNALP
jgi:Asp-tRNA(Asn)/Glu-tRNA(Gln) amidotransferase A subunit family amidase